MWRSWFVPLYINKFSFNMFIIKCKNFGCQMWYPGNRSKPSLWLINHNWKEKVEISGTYPLMEPYTLVQRTIILAFTKGGTDYPKGSLFMDVENSTLEDLVRLVQDRYSWNLIVGSLWPFLFRYCSIAPCRFLLCMNTYYVQCNLYCTVLVNIYWPFS